MVANEHGSLARAVNGRRVAVLIRTPDPQSSMYSTRASYSKGYAAPGYGIMAHAPLRGDVSTHDRGTLHRQHRAEGEPSAYTSPCTDKCQANTGTRTASAADRSKL